MTLRVSTAGMQLQALDALQLRQQSLARTQRQMASGNKLTRAADDPSGAAQAQRLDHLIAALDTYGHSAGQLQNRLQMQEQAFADGGEQLARAHDLAVQANNPALAASDRKAIAVELRQLRSQLIAVANRDDGNGRALFAGQRDGVVPFSDTAGTVSYVGDDGRNLVDVAPNLALADTDPGSDVFMRVRTGNGEIRGSAVASNTGTGVLQTTEVADHAVWAKGALRLAFTAPNAYQVIDSGGAVIASGAYAPGDTITAGGVQTRLTGTPATGDAFVLAPAPMRDVFATLQTLADALDAPVATPAEHARLANILGGAIGDMSTAQDHLLGLRADTGSRLSALDSGANTRLSEDESLRSMLSQLRDVDYAKAATELSLEMTAIEAAQRTMLKVQSLSLFNKIG